MKSILNVGPLSNIHNISCISIGLGKYVGLTLIWSKDVNLYILDSNQNLIDFYTMPTNSSNSNNMIWKGTGMYGYPKSNKKALTYKPINNLDQRHGYTNWILFGDLNLITNNKKKTWGDYIDNDLTNTINNTFY